MLDTSGPRPFWLDLPNNKQDQTFQLPSLSETRLFSFGRLTAHDLRCLASRNGLKSVGSLSEAALRRIAEINAEAKNSTYRTVWYEA